MMAGILIDGNIVCFEHDFNGMTLEYFKNFLLNEYIPAYKDELIENEIMQIHKGIKEQKDHIYIFKNRQQNDKKKLTHTFTYAKPLLFFNKSNCEFSGF